MADQTVTVTGTEHLAERACRMVFGDDADQGPVLPAPEPLLRLKEDWPAGRSDEAIDVALELPPTQFDLERERGKGEVLGVQLRVCRLTVLREGRKVGYAIRTNAAGLEACRLYDKAWTDFRRRMRQAH